MTEGAQRRWARGSPGQANIEYGFIVILVAILCVAVAAVAGHQVSNVFQNISNQLHLVGD